jgi:ATP-dependent Zn protease
MIGRLGCFCLALGAILTADASASEDLSQRVGEVFSRYDETNSLGCSVGGASNDLQRVTELPRKRVCEWGMSEELGPLHFGQDEIPVFLGRDVTRHQRHSKQTALKIDQEIKKVVLGAYGRARHILQANRKALVRLAEALLETETLDLLAVKP